jgi:hypothetical protein
VVELVPSVDELLLVDELGLDEMDEGEDGFEVHLLLGHRIALVGYLNAELSAFKAALAEVDLEEEAGAVFELIVHDPCWIHLQLRFLRLRAVDDHEDVIETDGAFIGYTNLAGHWEAIVAGHCKLPSHVELEAFQQD